jgi:hypothetical protein
MASQEKKIIISHSSNVYPILVEECVLQIAIWKRWSPDMKATIP